MDRSPTDFGQRLLDAAGHAGMTQTSLERRLVEAGLLSQGYVSRLVYGERGATSISIPLVEYIADLCGVDFHWLATGRGKMLPARTPPEPTRKRSDPPPPSDARPSVGKARS